MSNVVVRRAKRTDDLLKIATCIYLTDPFIYPAAFGPDIHTAASAISRLMELEGGLLHPDHIAIALSGEEICGILLYNKAGVTWDYEQCAGAVRELVPDIENFNHVAKAYFSAESIAPPENHIEVIACCVMPGFRNMGVGGRLIEWLAREYPEDALTLDVLADNPAAIRLYQKCGFKVAEAFKGFSMEEATRPDCYHMIRKPKF